MSPSQGSPLALLLPRLTSSTRGAGPATERPSGCPSSPASCHCWGAMAECWGSPSSQENPTLPSGVCATGRCATGKTATPSWNWRKRLVRRGKQRDPPKVHLLVPLQEAEPASRLFLALKAKVPTPRVLIPPPPPQPQEGRAEGSRTLALGDTTDRTEQEEKKPTPGDKDELARWSGAATFPGTGSQSPRPGSVPVPSSVCPGAGLPSPQVQGENHGHNHPQQQHKGQPGLHKPPYAAGGKGGRFKCEESAETKGWEKNWRNQRQTDA